MAKGKGKGKDAGPSAKEELASARAECERLAAELAAERSMVEALKQQLDAKDAELAVQLGNLVAEGEQHLDELDLMAEDKRVRAQRAQRAPRRRRRRLFRAAALRR